MYVGYVVTHKMGYVVTDNWAI